MDKDTKPSALLWNAGQPKDQVPVRWPFVQWNLTVAAVREAQFSAMSKQGATLLCFPDI